MYKRSNLPQVKQFFDRHTKTAPSSPIVLRTPLEKFGLERLVIHILVVFFVLPKTWKLTVSK